MITRDEATPNAAPKDATPKDATIVPHGTIDYAELRALGLRPEEITIFSSNINPFGPPPATIDALRAATTSDTIARYPDRLNLELSDLLGAYHALSAESVLVGNGTADLMWLIGLLYLQHRRVVILNPTFGEYLNVARIMSAEVIDVCHPGWIATRTGYALGQNTLGDVAKTLGKAQPDVIFVCNPNNPTGDYLTPGELEQLYQAAPNAIWIIDEAYAEFMHPPATSAAWVPRGNWLVLRSMTKDYALGGVRLGYLLGAPALVKPMQAAQSPWNVNIFAQIAGAVSLREGQAWRKETLSKLHDATQALQQELRAVGYDPHPTTVNYFLIPVESPSELRRALLADRLIVRDCTSFGLPHYIRIATQLPDANARLVQAMRAHAAHALPLTA
jgi:histidinol-phosphate aminotransferase